VLALTSGDNQSITELIARSSMHRY